MKVAIFIHHYESFEHSHSDWLNYTIPHGSTEIAEHIVRRYLNRYSHSAALKHGIWINITSFFYTLEIPIYYVGYLMIANICTYISLYIRNTTISINRKLVCISQHQLVNTCDLHLVKSLQYHMVPSWRSLALLPNIIQPHLIYTDLSCENARKSR